MTIHLNYRASQPAAPASTSIISAPLTNAQIDANFNSIQSHLNFTSDTSATTHYPLFGVTTANASIKYNSSLSFVPSTGLLTATDVASSSDATLKTNVATIENAVDIVKQMTGVTFNWIENQKPSSGVIAQEMERVVPHVVSLNEEGIRAVNYHALTAYLIQAVKELADRVEHLEQLK